MAIPVVRDRPRRENALEISNGGDCSGHWARFAPHAVTSESDSALVGALIQRREPLSIARKSSTPTDALGATASFGAALKACPYTTSKVSVSRP